MKRSSTEMQEPDAGAGSTVTSVESNKIPLNTVLKVMIKFLREYVNHP
jgi:hypothetical protein